MTGAEFKRIREALGVSRRDWATALGYKLAKPLQHITAMEGGRRVITPQVAHLVRMFELYGVPPGWLHPK